MKRQRRAIYKLTGLKSQKGSEEPTAKAPSQPIEVSVLRMLLFWTCQAPELPDNSFCSAKEPKTRLLTPWPKERGRPYEARPKLQVHSESTLVPLGFTYKTQTQRQDVSGVQRSAIINHQTPSKRFLTTWSMGCKVKYPTYTSFKRLPQLTISYGKQEALWPLEVYQASAQRLALPHTYCML